ncbi:MAG: DNA repair protein RecO [Proteobacteria bacterium]|nr:DNA repair protein RecO [Desulfobacteraceae bacterium]MBU2522336.1 DNA repair protein RecO [Pseudomonadota bacterium]MBU4100110.1 DNA repair protein RecO [Pseudomonadota bacterium]MBU4388348.1 DNA repair protein RecO [Pseudomonadota bacterium]
MSSFSTPAIVLRRIDFGDYDLIINFFTLNKGKISVIAKSAKKSVKRFSGVLEPFSVLEVVCSSGRGKGLPVLQEATLKQPFSKSRSDIVKIAYASYWAELINSWMEDGKKQVQIYELFQHVLGELDLDFTPMEALSIIFQIRFIKISGFCPDLTRCGNCRIEMEELKKEKIAFDVVKGCLICGSCSSAKSGKIYLSKGTIKQLLWVESGDLKKAGRIRFTSEALNEGLKFLEVFVPYHLGMEPRSLKFLRQIRSKRLSC